MASFMPAVFGFKVVKCEAKGDMGEGWLRLILTNNLRAWHPMCQPWPTTETRSRSSVVVVSLFARHGMFSTLIFVCIAWKSSPGVAEHKFSLQLINLPTFLFTLAWQIWRYCVVVCVSRLELFLTCLTMANSTESSDYDDELHEAAFRLKKHSSTLSRKSTLVRW